MCEKMHSSWNSGEKIYLKYFNQKRNCQETEMSFDCLYYTSKFNNFFFFFLLSDSNSFHQSSDHSTKHRIIRPKLHHGRHKRAITSTLEEVCFVVFFFWLISMCAVFNISIFIFDINKVKNPLLLILLNLKC